MKKSKIIITLLLMITLIMVYFTPFKSFANDSYNLIFTADDGHNIEIEDGHLKVDEQYVDPKLASNINENVSFSVEEDTTDSGGKFIMTIINGDEVVLNFNTADSYSLFASGNEVKVNETVFNSETNIRVQNASQQQSQIGGPDNNNRENAGITVTAGNGTYYNNGNNRAYDADVEVLINNERWNHSNTISYETNNEDTTVTFTFETLWINKFYEDIVINGVAYNVSDYIDFDDRTDWLVANHGSQVLSFDIPNVAKADNYNIVVKNGENSGQKYLATFLWTADPAQADGYDYIGNAKLEFVKAVYSVGNTKYTVTEEDLEGKLHREGGFLNAHSEDGFLNYGITADVDFDDGSLTLPGNAEITMRVVPEYGYQVTSVNGGEDFKTTDAGVSEFTVTVADGTAGYFQATVEKVDNTVTPTSEKVKSGEIKLGDNAATDIKNGTVRLSVEDVELSSDKIKGFEGAAGDYTISNYLDIDLYQVFYKGKNDEDDVWSNKIDELTNEATIKIKLAEGVNADDIVLIHNVHDGEEYEIIEIESYDPETNTITFKTKSFSNYAIATKASATNKEKTNPKTGDIIAVFFAIFVVSMGGLITTQRMKKKVNISKH